MPTCIQCSAVKITEYDRFLIKLACNPFTHFLIVTTGTKQQNNDRHSRQETIKPAAVMSTIKSRLRFRTTVAIGYFITLYGILPVQPCRFPAGNQAETVSAYHGGGRVVAHINDAGLPEPAAWNSLPPSVQELSKTDCWVYIKHWLGRMLNIALVLGAHSTNRYE